MKHFVYRTSHPDGSYYIGRHSTKNINDGYIGSGSWIRELADRSVLIREIVEWADDVESLMEAEQRWIDEHFGKPGCKNKNPKSSGFPVGLENHPNKDGRNAKLAMERGTHVNLGENNPSKQRSRRGIHQWQNGKSPNFQGKLNEKRVSEHTHNWLGSEHNQKMIDAGTHNFLGPSQNKKMLAEGKHPSQIKVICEHCDTLSSKGMYVRWHGDRCRHKK